MAQLDVTKLNYAYQYDDWDCGPAAGAIALQKVVSVYFGGDCGPLSSRYLSLQMYEMGWIPQVEIPTSAFNSCHAVNAVRSCGWSICPPSAQAVTYAMIEEAAKLPTPRVVTWDSGLRSFDKAVEILGQQNAAIVVVQALHAQVLVGVDRSSFVRIDAFQSRLEKSRGKVPVDYPSQSSMKRFWSRVTDAAQICAILL